MKINNVEGVTATQVRKHFGQQIMITADATKSYYICIKSKNSKVIQISFQQTC